MKVQSIFNISKCIDCPFTENHYEQGCSGVVCKFIPYGWIKSDTILPECPLKDTSITIQLTKN